MTMKQFRIDFNKLNLGVCSIPSVFTQSSNVIKELVHAFTCAYIELSMHLGSL